MSIEKHDLAEFFVAMERSSTFEDRCAALEAFTKSQGFEQIVYLSMIDPAYAAPHNAANFISLDRRYPPWVQEYNECGLAGADPVRRAIRDQYLPVIYEDVQLITPAEVRYRDRAIRDGRQYNGMAFAIEAAHGRQCGFGCVQRDDRPSEAVALAVMSVVKVFHVFAEAEFAGAAAEKLEISTREMSIVRKMQADMRPKQIAEEFGLSDRYVYKVIDQLKERFNFQTNGALVDFLIRQGVLR